VAAAHVHWPHDEENVGMLIIGNLDNDGYLKEPPLADIADEAQVSPEFAQNVLTKLQGFDPVGVCARSLSECLLIQARHIGADDDILVKMITEHLGNLEKKNYQAIARDLKEPVEEIYEAAKVIMTLNPKPGHEYSTEEPHYITPDVYVHKVGDKFFVVPNDDGLPKLKISSFYKTALGGNGKAKSTFKTSCARRSGSSARSSSGSGRSSRSPSRSSSSSASSSKKASRI